VVRFEARYQSNQCTLDCSNGSVNVDGILCGSENRVTKKCPAFSLTGAGHFLSQNPRSRFSVR
jgi:hypothetical protein